MAITMRDIAKELGISVNTVSRAMTGNEEISPKTKIKILKKAEELNYVPNSMAKSLRNGKSNAVAIVYDNMLNTYYSIVTALLERELRSQNYFIMLFVDYSNSFKLSRETAIRILSSGATALVSYVEIDSEVARLFEQENVPVLVLGRSSSDKYINTIVTDDYMGGKIAAEHLIFCGCKRILMISIPSEISCASEREQGFLDAINGKVEGNILHILETIDDSVEEKLKTVNIKDYDGMFCFNDQIAFEVISILESMGYDVPEDIMIVGYDNVQSHMIMPRRITSIDTNKNQIASAAANIIMEQSRNPAAPKRAEKIANVKLVIGKTTRL